MCMCQTPVQALGHTASETEEMAALRDSALREEAP